MAKKYRSIALAIIFFFPLLFIFPSQAIAQEGDDGEGRFKVIETTFTQYTWRLVSRSSGAVLCTVTINHEGFPTAVETQAACGQSLFTLYPTESPELPPGVTPQPLPTSQITPTPVNMAQIFLDTYWVFVSEEQVSQTTKIEVPDIIVNIYAPGLPVTAPYVIIKAIEPFSEYEITRIAGDLNGDPFECRSDQCIIPITQDSQISFWAESSFGDRTDTISATIRTFISNNFYNVRVTVLDQRIEFNDSCRAIWGDTAQGVTPDWVVFPESPDLLNTDHTLHYLAGKLILNRFVDASSCPDGGLYANGAPNGCGLQVAREAMISWQNRFDPVIWASGKQHGIAPILIKSLIEQETQFWPENARYLYEEYGFTQINELGADVALRWDEDLKNQVCSSLLYDCDPSFANMNSFEQAMLRGALIRSIDAYCPACENMINLDIAEQSISITAQVIRANCAQTNFIMENEELKTSVEDMWKFTILSYHAGYQCLEGSLQAVKNKGLRPDWENVSANLVCPNAKAYVDAVWDKLVSFQFNYAPQPTLPPALLTPTGQPGLVEIPATITPLPTSTPTPISYLYDGVMHIFLYIDYNNNLVMDEEELVNNAELIVEFANGEIINVPVIEGEATIEYENQFRNSNVKITIKDIYHSTEIKIPETGELYDIIRIPPPDLPGRLP